MNNLWIPHENATVVARINRLTPATQPRWGTMSVGQMLAHCCVSYEMVFEQKHSKPPFAVKLLLNLLVKKAVVSDMPFKKHSRTGPQFVIKETRDFALEKQRLLDFIQKTFDLGEAYFDGRDYPSFGRLKLSEWNNLFYKHLDHHLSQFGV
jgi:Protein of unknown function (DUF1569)